MQNYDTDLSCPSCGAPMIEIRNASAAYLKRIAEEEICKIHCGCGSIVRMRDDEVPVGSGGGVKIEDLSAPRIDSLSVSAGSRAGGESLSITGAALDVGDLTVKFGGLAATISSRTPTSAQVTTPPGCYQLLLIENVMDKVLLSGVGGTFIEDEGVTFGDTGATGTLRRIDGNDYYVAFTSLPVSRDDLVGKLVTGGISAATGTCSVVATVNLIIGEAVVGQISGATAVVRTPSPLVVDNPSDSFGPNELVVGQASGATVKLSTSPAYSGLVDVTVENENGQRIDGGTLADAFTYF